MDLQDLLQIPFTLYLTIFLVVLFYKYMTWNYDYWKNRNVPGNQPWIFMGTLKPFWICPIELQDMECFKKYGNTFGGFEGTQPVLYTIDPDIIRQVTVKDFGAFPNRRKYTKSGETKYVKDMVAIIRDDKWKSLRNTLTQTFTTGKLKQMTGLIEECVEDLNQSLEAKVDKDEIVEMADQFVYLTLNIIASVAFGIKLDCVNNPRNEFIMKAKTAFRSYPILSYFTFILPKLFLFLPSFALSNFQYFDNVADQAIDLRLKNKTLVRKDFLEIMLNAEIVDSDENSSTNDEKPMTKNQPNLGSITTSKKIMTRDSIIAQSILFILAGHETTAATLSQLAYELALNPNIQNKLILEIDDVMNECKGKINYEAIAGMQYLDMVVSETLRLYPPATRVERLCEQKNYVVKDIKINKDVIVSIPVFVLHRNPEFYPNPEVFDPDRFLPENKQKRNPFTYIPFGSGPRNCIAMRFALMEIKISIVLVLCKFRFETCEKTEFPLQVLSGGFGLRSPKSVYLRLQKRTDNPHFNE